MILGTKNFHPAASTVFHKWNTFFALFMILFFLKLFKKIIDLNSSILTYHAYSLILLYLSNFLGFYLLFSLSFFNAKVK